MRNNENFTTLLIELNQTCNLNCDFCFYRDYGRKENYLELNDLKSIIKKFPNLNNFFITGGECTLHKDILQIVDYLGNKGSVSIFTNGYLIDKDINKYLKLEKIINKCYLTIHECDYGEIIYRDVYDFLDREKTIIKININRYNFDNITNVLDMYISKGFYLFSFNYIHNIFSSRKDYAVSFGNLDSLIIKLEKYKKYIDLENMKMQLNLKKGVCNRNIGLCGKKFIYLNCSGIIYNCPSAMNEDIYCTCENCKMPMAECVSLLEIFKGE